MNVQPSKHLILINGHTYQGHGLNKYAISHVHDCSSPRGPFDGYPSDAASTN